MIWNNKDPHIFSEKTALLLHTICLEMQRSSHFFQQKNGFDFAYNMLGNVTSCLLTTLLVLNNHSYTQELD